ncbi:class I SAM-dependent methyltransferase [Alienimonas sp. DA493]|uniref:class I SAM-dependent methyltransferase n=1 Tax=Alienimonas sp. DA493 TaxID=3373605 RepID=UPI003754168D
MILPLLCLACGFAAPLQDNAPPAPAAAELYEDRPGADPNGIDRYYMGRQIARVMGHQGANWLERRTRQQEEDLNTLIRLLKLEPGMTVADIGAGSGVIAQRMAPKVDNGEAPGGVVKAVDIQPEMIARLRGRMKQRGIDNVEPVLSDPTDPKLEPGSVDVAVMVDVYHEFDDPHAMTAALVKALKPGGRLVWVEYRAEDPRVPIKAIHKMSEAQVKKEASRPEFGLEYVDTADALPRQHVITFRKPAADEAEDAAE